MDHVIYGGMINSGFFNIVSQLYVYDSNEIDEIDIIRSNSGNN